MRWAIGASMVFTLLLGVSVAHGGGRWSGMDPEIRANGHKVNVWVEWPTEMTCEVTGVKVTMLVPLLTDVQFIGESQETFTCDDGSQVTLSTETTVQRALVKSVNVSAVIESQSVEASVEGGLLDLSASLEAELNEFPVNVRVYKNDSLIRECSGLSNVAVECLPFLVAR